MRRFMGIAALVVSLGCGKHIVRGHDCEEILEITPHNDSSYILKYRTQENVEVTRSVHSRELFQCGEQLISPVDYSGVVNSYGL
ncbi:hypothetical protein HQ545_03570 [Candidatus Woesearchaeota archaeon]|nr:hypothetical protein [Candidatus Woesearchaeota archaeon]